MRVRSTGIWQDWDAAMGAIPVSMTASEIYSGLNQGTLDCTTSPITYLKSFGLMDVINYVLDMPVGAYRPAILLDISLKSWKQLTADQKAAITDNLATLAADAGWSYQEQGNAILNSATKSGITFVSPGQDIKQANKKFLSQSKKDFIELARKRGMDHPKEILSTYITLIDKWQKITETLSSKSDYKEALEKNVFSKLRWISKN
jgi:TRAP-type C4-dicarboxylate transport system substrate-binding protein